MCYSKNQALELELAHVRSSFSNLKMQDDTKSACLEQLSYVLLLSHTFDLIML